MVIQELVKVLVIGIDEWPLYERVVRGLRWISRCNRLSRFMLLLKLLYEDRREDQAGYPSPTLWYGCAKRASDPSKALTT